MSALVDEDLRLIWHPAAQMKDYELHPPVAVVAGEGCWLRTEDGRKILDVVSSWWCNLLGHCNAEITEALSAQARTLEHVIFADLTHPWAVRLAQELSLIVPKGLCRFNFADNGSSAVEMCLKLAFQYQAQTGHPERIRFACLSEGYHGETIGALSVGSMDLYAKLYRPMMMNNLHIRAPDCFRCPCGKQRGHCKCECLKFAEQAFAGHGAELAALIVEPLLQGAAGMRVYPEEYLRGLRKLCTQHGVLLIADEIATGFGRTGEIFACVKAGVSPDLMALSKAITGGYMPMSVVCATQEVYDAFYADYKEGKAFVHSHTYAGNPLACSCALAVLKILKRDHIIEKARKTASWLTAEFEKRFLKIENVGEVRHIGLIHAIELVKDRRSKEPFDPSLRLGYRIYRRALSEGLLLRCIGDVLYFNPPLVISQKELEFAQDVTERCVRAELEKL
ncbi:MAG: adenosylmethionine--8-amino-7-oxononanoate transaminase [Succinivibrio sp.]|nr:adenosylmethionine--8-amino-7-oxononanoate transaminase [Succinivibrio sp.]